MKVNSETHKNILFRLILILVLLCVSVRRIYAQQSIPLVDPGDSFYVTTPAPNTFVKGTIPINFFIQDDERNGLEYTISLFDAASCTSLIGNIATGFGEGSLSSNWNTRTTLSNSNLADGQYCLRVCTALRNADQGEYAACNARVVHTLNNNTKPIITSSLQQTVYYQSLNQTFRYQLTARDAENDPLTYRLISAPSILVINPTTGLITSTGALSTYGQTGLRYTVTVGVTDNKAGEITQTFVFDVYPAPPQPPTNPPPTNGGTTNPPPTNNDDDDTPPTDDDDTDDDDDGTDGDDDDDGDDDGTDDPNEVQIDDFSFVGIDEDTVFTTSPVDVSWSYGEDFELVDNANLEFSTDGENWNRLQENMPPDKTSYTWDISELPNGEYYLRVVINKTDGLQQIEASDLFIINKPGDGEQTNTALIVEVSPDPDATIQELKPEISGKLIPSLDATIEANSLIVTIDGRDITELCVLEEDQFKCSLDEDLETGRHVVTATFKDSAESTAEREWTFSISLEDEDDGDDSGSDGEGGGLSRSAITFIGVLICLGLIILIVPWLLYTMWSGRNKTKEVKTETTYTINSDGSNLDNLDYPDININTNYTDPTTDYVQPYDLNSTTETTTTTDYPDYIQPYDQTTTTTTTTNNDDEFVEPTQTS